MSKRTKPIPATVLGIMAGVTIVVVAWIVFDPLTTRSGADEGGGAEGESVIAAERERGEITLADLSITHEADGELRFAEVRDISATANATGGTVTALAPAGRSVGASEVLYEIDGAPTVALIGEVPAWRTMTVDDVGVDVLQLETNLVALGYDAEGSLSVDETFTSYTAEVVKRWQEDLGVEASGDVGFGSVAFGSVVFVPPNSTTATVDGAVGTSPQGVLVSVASNERELAFPVGAELLDTIAVGTSVSARLPDRSSVTATVVGLAPSGDGSWEAVAEISSIDSEVALPEGDAIPMTVSWVEDIASEAKTVRADALIRLDGGGYALELVVSDEETEFVPVGIGAQSGSTVEIVTDLDVGTVFIAS